MNYLTRGIILFVLSSQLASAAYLVKFKANTRPVRALLDRELGVSFHNVLPEENLYLWKTEDPRAVLRLSRSPDVSYIEEDQPLAPPPLFYLTEAEKAQARRWIATLPKAGQPSTASGSEKPAFQMAPNQGKGADPLLSLAWGIASIGAPAAWTTLPQGKGITVAVIDTGVDYNHEDLISNIWRNPGEIPNDGLDNDNNGYVDDVVGWDFAENDNRPFDVTTSLLDILMNGGNSGHGTHVSGVIAAVLNNKLGTAGVAPGAKIMCLRFLKAKGGGSTADAVKAVDYAVKNGAQIINASWGGDGGNNKTLEEAIDRARAKGVLFVAAAGNGRRKADGKVSGVDNDTDSRPFYPASFTHSNVVTVAAIASNDQLAYFSNYGKTKVHLAAPGVQVLSTVPGDRYQDKVIDIGPLKASWNGTSMAAPFVSGALAVLLSKDPKAQPEEVRKILLQSTTPVEILKDKVASGGKLSLKNLPK